MRQREQILFLFLFYLNEPHLSLSFLPQVLNLTLNLSSSLSLLINHLYLFAVQSISSGVLSTLICLSCSEINLELLLHSYINLLQ